MAHFMVTASRDYFIPGTAGEQGKTIMVEAHERAAAFAVRDALKTAGWDAEVREWTRRQRIELVRGRPVWRAGFVEAA